MSTLPTFLIVDDSYIDRLVASMLIKHTFNTATVVDVASGEQALSWLEANRLDLNGNLVILLDIMMPAMNGFEVLEAMARIDGLNPKHVTVFMLSSTLDDEDIRKAEQHQQVKKLLSKPLSVKELQQLVLLLQSSA